MRASIWISPLFSDNPELADIFHAETSSSGDADKISSARRKNLSACRKMHPV